MSTSTLIADGFGSFGDIAHIVRVGLDANVTTGYPYLITDGFGSFGDVAHIVTMGLAPDSISSPSSPGTLALYPSGRHGRFRRGIGARGR